MEGGTAAAVESKFLLTGIRFVLKKTFSVQELQQVLQACNQFSDVDKELPAQRCLVFGIFPSSFPELAVFKTVCSSLLFLTYHTLLNYKREQFIGLIAVRKPFEFSALYKREGQTLQRISTTTLSFTSKGPSSLAVFPRHVRRERGQGCRRSAVHESADDSQHSNH